MIKGMLAVSVVKLGRSFWARVAILLAVVLVVLPDSVVWDNVSRRFTYGFLSIDVWVSPLSGALLGIRAMPATDFQLVAYVLKFLVASFLVLEYFREKHLSSKATVFGLLMLMVSFLVYSEAVIFNTLLQLWLARPIYVHPSGELVGGLLGWLKPHAGAVRLATPVTFGLIGCLAMVLRHQPLPFPPQEAVALLLTEERGTFPRMDKIAGIWLAGDLVLILWAPWFFSWSWPFSVPLIHGLLGYLTLFLALRVLRVLGFEKTSRILKTLYGAKGRSKVIWLVLCGSLLTAAAYYLVQPSNIVTLFHAGFLLTLALPLLAATLLTQLPSP